MKLPLLKLLLIQIQLFRGETSITAFHPYRVTRLSTRQTRFIRPYSNLVPYGASCGVCVPTGSRVRVCDFITLYFFHQSWLTHFIFVRRGMPTSSPAQDIRKISWQTLTGNVARAEHYSIAACAGSRKGREEKKRVTWPKLNIILLQSVPVVGRAEKKKSGLYGQS